MWADLKYALRQLRSSPGFTITAVLTLAIGIGVNTAVFSFMDALVLHPLAVPDLDRVVTLAEQQDRGEPVQVSFANYEDWKRDSRSFEDLAVRAYGSMNMSGAGDAAHVESSIVSPNFFALLRVNPWLGRGFRDDEAQPGRDAVTILSYSFWQRQFGGDPQIIGRRVELDARAYTIIGVMPRSLEYPPAADIFLPMAATAQQRSDRVGRNYLVLGRLRIRSCRAAGNAGSRKSAGSPISGHEPRLGCHRHAVAEGSQRTAYVDVFPLDHGRDHLRASYRLRECSESAVCPRTGAPQRDRGSHRSGRPPLGAAPSTAGGAYYWAWSAPQVDCCWPTSACVLIWPSCPSV
jgi:hypothetical protein